MTGDLRDLLAVRDGHFRFESGHHGRLWLDLEAVFWHPAAVEPLAAELSRRLARHDVEAVVAPLAGGALLGFRVAAMLGVPFAATERRAVERDAMYSAAYVLPASPGRRLSGLRVALVDDVVNAGSAVGASLAAVTAQGGVPVVTGALLRLGLHRLPPREFPLVRSLATALAQYDGAAELDEGLDILLTGLRSHLRPLRS